MAKGMDKGTSVELDTMVPSSMRKGTIAALLKLPKAQVNSVEEDDGYVIIKAQFWLEVI